MIRHGSSLRAAALLLVTLAVPASSRAQAGAKAEPTAAQILAAIGVQEGSTVCEIGAGEGQMTLAAARIVGAGGRVFSSELGDARVKRLQERVAGSELAPITVVAGDVARTNFPDGGCDALFMSDVYHHFSEPAAMNASIARALKPGGRVAVLDFTPPGKEAPRPAERGDDGMHGILPETVAREMTDAGLELVSTERGWRWFLSVFSRPKV
jgi:ubiquinone/menaquinone biosynthesis C-methylase UbiE